MKFTCALSNVPGPIKPFEFTDINGKKGYGRWCMPYFMVAGRTGLAISCVSYGENFMINISGDEGIIKDTQYLNDLIEQNIVKEIEIMD